MILLLFLQRGTRHWSYPRLMWWPYVFKQNSTLRIFPVVSSLNMWLSSLLGLNPIDKMMSPTIMKTWHEHDSHDKHEYPDMSSNSCFWSRTLFYSVIFFVFLMWICKHFFLKIYIFFFLIECLLCVIFNTCLSVTWCTI